MASTKATVTFEDEINKSKEEPTEQNKQNNKIANSNNKQENGGPISNTGPDVNLSKEVLNDLYISYSIKQRQPAMVVFLSAIILFDIWCIITPHGFCWKTLGIFAGNAVCSLILLILIYFRGSKLNKKIWKPLTFPIWFLVIAQVVFFSILKPILTIRELLGWTILIVFLIYVTFPLQLIFIGGFYGLGFKIVYLILMFIYAIHDSYFGEQFTATLIVILSSTSIGLLAFLVGERKQKRAFLEAKKSLEVKMIIEEQSEEQEKLLLSVLPEHVAVKMRQDLGSKNSEQFKKIYMSRHENVSILYADIVGFTAISSTYSAQDLVKMLNELFARFDKLAEKYQQLRIKILGDCYYCISGAPIERPDHAVLCVHMGLSMVKAIKYVQQKTNSPVDMRVGIHTGAILAGILGQRQWQFDVYSKDVELANKMESSGKAGRVHISEKTLAFLNGEFGIEPAFGEKREEALRIAGLKTYFITSVLKPFVSSEHKINGITPSGTSGDISDDDNDGTTEPDATEIVPDEDSKANSEDTKNKEEVFKQRLRNELFKKDDIRDLSKDTTIFLTFKDKELEKLYVTQRESCSPYLLMAAPIVQITDVLYSSLALPRLWQHFLIVLVPLTVIAALVLFLMAESFQKVFPEFFYKISKKINDIVLLRKTTAVLIILTMGLSNLIDMWFYASLYNYKTDSLNFTTKAMSVNNSFENISEIIKETVPNFTKKQINNFDTDFTEDNLNFPSYMSNFCILILIAIAVIAQLTHICKALLMISISILHCIFNIFLLNYSYEFEDFYASFPNISVKYSVSLTLLLAALILSFLARHMDKEDRVIFKWKNEVAGQNEKVSDMRRRNEALVYNILPVHVAEHFMKNRKRSHDYLYSQSYAEVGVLFASMPNFTDFYSEETVNNQGLECLRFLNEVISDFDALLELPKFQDVIKIKTIGSTYMAASGLNPAREIAPNDSITVRWAHLSHLVEFALELKKALQGINEQSFNHFVLKMGINHGPIIAGVIGARKPHYDIWGNTVNVASRMESTGKAGYIQVTEETMLILREFDYKFIQRGLVAVKGKGQLMTYYLMGKSVEGNTSISPQSLKTVNPPADPDVQNLMNEEPKVCHNNLESPSKEKHNLHNGRENLNNEIKANTDQDIEIEDAKTPLLHKTNDPSDGCSNKLNNFSNEEHNYLISKSTKNNDITSNP
ncbi:adenylate cyclase type 3 [Condylostylus longicornis]|uniref:adenylate cyclase type 3 n=1 Tax=Condylostylus longicornis TaxID=2530218 RepID=UPI00244E1D83|nr:adenylate cyclase type 3 [Condylostylus longicornis]XP_055387230.1 adenylate cyclase type 3 [Condylostylus longicornis]